MSLLPPRKTGETRYDEALRQLASDDIMRDARYRYDHDNLCYVQEQPRFRYWTIAYTYPSGLVIWQGAYADKSLADMTARLNQALAAEVKEVWY
jgi:hypothetical protein